MRALRFFLDPRPAGTPGAVRRQFHRLAGGVLGPGRKEWGDRPDGSRRTALAAPGWLAGLLALCLLLALPALAQGIPSGLFDGARDAGARDLLAVLDRPRGALAAMLFAYNTTLLALAGALLLWHAAAALVDTAREGRIRPGLWAALRITVALALMAPLGHGMNAAQHLTLRLAHLGADFAAAVWTPFADEVLAKGKPLAPHIAERAARATLVRLLLVETCRHAADGAARAAGDGNAIRLRPATRGGRLAALHYDGNGGGRPRDLCGAIHYATPRGTGAGGAAAAEAHRAALEALRPRIARLAASLAAHHVPGTPQHGQPLAGLEQRLAAARLAEDHAARLQPALERALAAEHTARQAAAREAAGAGWLQAATVFNTLAARTGAFRAAATRLPEIALPRANLATWSLAADSAVKAVARNLQATSDWPLPLATASLGPIGAPPRGDGEGRGLLDIVDLESVTIASGDNPILDLASLGHGLIAAALAAIAALSGVAAGSNLLESVPLVGQGLDAFEAIWSVGDAFVSLILAALLIAGATLAYILPAIPFIRFLFATLAWLLNLAAALLAVTVFCAAHVSRAQDNSLILPATRTGWLFLPGLVLRPPLMLFGLILGYLVTLAAMRLFNAAWLPQMRDAVGDGLGPVGYLAMLYLYIVIAYALINGAFKLIEILPAAALEWIGGRGEAGGEADRLTSAATAGLGRLGALRVGSRRGGRNTPLPPAP